jgi:hypothetical protein
LTAKPLPIHYGAPRNCRRFGPQTFGAMKIPFVVVALATLSTVLVPAQSTPRRIALTDSSTIPHDEILKPFQRACPNVEIVSDAAKGDYRLEATSKTVRQGLRIESFNSFDLTLFDRDGKTVRSTSTTSVGSAVRDICHAIKTSVMVEVVDAQNLTQAQDTRGDTSGGAVGTVVNGLTGRRTHTDTSTIYVIVNGEHALLDCYERRTGCTAIGPGKYYGEHDGDGIWVSYQMPIVHKQVSATITGSRGAGSSTGLHVFGRRLS